MWWENLNHDWLLLTLLHKIKLEVVVFLIPNRAPEVQMQRYFRGGLQQKLKEDSGFVQRKVFCLLFPRVPSNAHLFTYSLSLVKPVSPMAVGGRAKLTRISPQISKGVAESLQTASAISGRAALPEGVSGSAKHNFFPPRNCLIFL